MYGEFHLGDDTEIKISNLDIGESAYKSWLDLQLCFGRYTTGGKGHRDENYYINQTDDYRARGWWKITRVSKTQVETKYVPRNFDKKSIKWGLREIGLSGGALINFG